MAGFPTPRRSNAACVIDSIQLAISGTSTATARTKTGSEMAMKGDAPALHLDPETRRALQLDALAAILPMDRRDRLAELLTDDDVETLKHLAREGMGENRLRALASDLAYLEAWANAPAGQPLLWPASEALALKFVAHHLWDPAKRVSDTRHGMPPDVADSLRREACCAAMALMLRTPSGGA
jgi:hypothetical protein